MSQTTTNFDLPSLHLLRQEIAVVLKDAEVHLREFYDDPDQASLLLDSANNLAQLASVFELISFNGAGLLTKHLAKSYHKLYDNADAGEDNDALMTDISEAVMLVDRYVEFVLLKETLEPALLLPIINKLREHLGESPINVDTLKQNNNSVIITDPAANYTSLSTLGLNTKALVQAYRAGLSVILEFKDEDTVASLSDDQRKKLDGMGKACAMIAEHSDTLFWQSAAALTQNIASDLPMSHAKKRILIYLEQQFSDYLPIEDRRFAELVSFACNKDNSFAIAANQKYALNKVSQTKFEQMQRFLFGPNHEITDTLNSLIQEHIENIKQKVDDFVRAQDGLPTMGEAVGAQDIADELTILSQTMHLLELNDASQALQQAATEVSTWQSPTLDDLDALLDRLMVAENAAIFLAKTHTPGAVKLPLHNREISLHRLDTAYETLIKEARTSLAIISTALSDYLADNKDAEVTLSDTPEMIRQVAGAAAFLRLDVVAKQLYRLANKLEKDLLEKISTLSSTQLTHLTNAWADVIVAADMEFESFALNRPTSKQALLLSEYSLSQLLAA